MKPPINDFWGKLKRDESGEVVGWHPLLAHCADVAAVMEGLLSVKVIRRRLSRLAQRELNDIDVARLCYLTVLHDAGKTNAGFQAKKDLQARTAWAGHVGEMLWAVMGEDSPGTLKMSLCNALDLRSIQHWFSEEEELCRYLAASIAHHGAPFDIMALPRTKGGDWLAKTTLDPMDGVSRLAKAARLWFPRSFEESAPLPTHPPFIHAFSGLVMLADWIGSDASESAFPYAYEGETNRIAFARERTVQVLDSLGLESKAARSQMGAIAPGFEVLKAEPQHSIRPAQAAVAELEPDAEGSVVILEAETGSGKTEAALLHFMKLFHGGHVDGLYFALPTRTAATQIHERVCRAVAQVFRERQTRPSVVLAVPGYLKVDDVTGTKGEGFNINWGLSLPDTLWPDDERERMRFRGWAAEHPKRYLAGTIVVGTIDQVLLSALKVNHAHLRMTALLRHLLVVDEVHASDAYMTEILEEVLQRHRSAGGHAFLMSATLGASTRSRLLGLNNKASRLSLEQALAAPYPMLSTWSASQDHALLERAIEHEGPQRNIEVQLHNTMQDASSVAQRALAAARRGARVLVIRNTVQACLTTQVALEELAQDPSDRALLFGVGDIPAPHHARYAKTDRTVLDNALERRFGKKRDGVSDGAVAIATQTVQQSLDLDADLLITDLCPMDVLLQRVGRLHRHARGDRPAGFENAVVEVLTPDVASLDGYLQSNGEPRGPSGTGIGTVYDDLRILEATWRILTRTPRFEIPNASREFVERAVHPEALAALVQELGGNWGKHAGKVTGRTGADVVIARLNGYRLDEPYGSFTFSHKQDGKIQTRLGEGDRLATFPKRLVSALGQAIESLTIQHWLVRDVDAEAEVSDLVAGSKEITFSLGPKTFVYDRLGLRIRVDGEKQ